MCLTVPNHVDKTKQVILVSDGYPSKAVSLKQGFPIGLLRGINSRFKRVAVKDSELRVFKLSPPFVGTCHDFMVFVGKLERLRLGPDVSGLTPRCSFAMPPMVRESR